MKQLQPRRNIQRILEDLPIRELHNRQDCQWLCDYVGRCVVPDLRLQVWEIEAELFDPFAVRGYVSNPFGLKALVKIAEELGFSCDTRAVQIVPNESAYSFGTIEQRECPLYATPSEDECVDTALPGETLVVLRREENHALVHAPNGYLGWVNNQRFEEISTQEWLMAISGKSENRHYETLSETAKALLGTPYVWGGADAAGIDCSGFVRFVYKRIGVQLPRDADQQFTTGTLCALPGLYEGMRIGDLLFFSGGYGGIGHVGMALQARHFIHARGEVGVTVSSVDEEPDLMKHFMVAKRVLR